MVPRFFPGRFYGLSQLCAGKRLTTSSLRIRVLVYSIWWFLWCKFSRHSRFHWTESQEEIRTTVTSSTPLVYLLCSMIKPRRPWLSSRVAQPCKKLFMKQCSFIFCCCFNLLCLDTVLFCDLFLFSLSDCLILSQYILLLYLSACILSFSFYFFTLLTYFRWERWVWNHPFTKRGRELMSWSAKIGPLARALAARVLKLDWFRG